MKKRLSDTTLSWLIAIALHVFVIILLIRFGSTTPEPLPGLKDVVQIEGAGGAVGGAGSPDFGAMAPPHEALAICVYSQSGETIRLDTTIPPKQNPSFTKCPATIADLAPAKKKVVGVFKFTLMHRRVAGFSVVESTGDNTTDSTIVANVLRQGLWTSDSHLQPERIAYIVKVGK